MKSSRKGFVFAGLLAAMASLTGCGGISGSQGVSPANFLMPGVMNRPLMPSAETSLASHNRESGTALPSGVAAGSVISASQEKPVASLNNSSSNDL